MSEIAKTATISDCGRYRYWLSRKWDDGPSLAFVMLNPSTADADVDDPTIRRCMSFARRDGYGGIVVINLFAFRAAKPKVLWATPPLERIGLHNERAFAQVVAQVDPTIVCAWGASAGSAATHAISYLKANGAWLVCLGKTKEGHPRHPLYVRGDQPLVVFS